jgi:predicted nucleotidyltransferase
MNVVLTGFETAMNAHEGDLIETFDGNIFDVKGLVHPPDKIVAFIRFTPDPNGERSRDNLRYRKVYALRERYALLRAMFPQYLVLDPVFKQWLCEVPVNMVMTHYKPVEFLSQLRHKRSLNRLEGISFELARLLRNRAGIDWSALGISGSLLVGLHTERSDIDLVVYGSGNCRKVHAALTRLTRDRKSGVKPYDESDLRTLFDFRSKDTVVGFEDFVRTESRKVLQGKFQGRDYFIRCVKELGEITDTYGSTRYEGAGEATVSAFVTDDSDMIFTPCTYRINRVQARAGKVPKLLREIASFRGRFCEQAKAGERIIARGMVERVKEKGRSEYFRLLLGNKPSDFMILDR